MKPARSHLLVVGVAVVAGLLGLVAALLVDGPGPLLRSGFGQRVVLRALQASAPTQPDGVVVARRGQRLPPLRLAGLDGRPAALRELAAGRPLLVNVWASWCGPCLEEMPALQAFADGQGAEGVQVVGIALDDPAAVRGFLQRVPVRYPILVDAPGPADAGVRLGNPAGVLPYSVLVSADGVLLEQRIGPFAAGEIPGWVRTATGR